MKRIFFNLASLGIVLVGGGLVFLQFNPKYQEYFSTNLGGKKPTEFDIKLRKISEEAEKWPKGLYPNDEFIKLNDSLAFRWVTYKDCNAPKCNSIEVISRFGCPNSLYAQVTQLDKDNRNIGYSNDSTSRIKPNQKALLKFRSWEKDLKTWSLEEINCR